MESRGWSSAEFFADLGIPFGGGSNNASGGSNGGSDNASDDNSSLGNDIAGLEVFQDTKHEFDWLDEGFDDDLELEKVDSLLAVDIGAYKQKNLVPAADRYRLFAVENLALVATVHSTKIKQYKLKHDVSEPGSTKKLFYTKKLEKWNEKFDDLKFYFGKAKSGAAAIVTAREEVLEEFKSDLRPLKAWVEMEGPGSLGDIKKRFDDVALLARVAYRNWKDAKKILAHAEHVFDQEVARVIVANGTTV